MPAVTRIGQRDLTYYSEQRTRIEVELAKSLYAIFNAPPIITSLREIVGLVIGDLAARAEYDPDPATRTAIKNAFTEESNLDAWRGNTKDADGLFKVWQNRATWSASECADLLRLYGTAIEKAPGTIGGTVKAEHGSARVGGDARFKNLGPTEANPAPLGRSRMPAKNPNPDANYQKAPHSDAARTIIKAVKTNPDAFWGIGPFRLASGSTIRKMDIAFGLPEGADISGTTADSIFGMTRVLNFATAAENSAGGWDVSGGVPVGVLKLLPLVSMISQGHHTILESAAVLTLNGIIDYSVGAYTTLMPPSASGGTDLTGQLRKLCAAAESNTFNVPLVGFYDPGTKKYAGYMYDRTNRDVMNKFRKMATVSEDLLEYFRNEVTALVPKEKIDALLLENQLPTA